MKKLQVILFAVFLTLAPRLLSAGITYYVCTNGDDLKDGLSWSNSWRTAQKAAATMTNGDTALFAAGTYAIGGGIADGYSSRLLITNGGVSGAPITYRGYTNGVLISATGNNCGIFIFQAGYIIIDNLNVAGALNNGICLSTGAQYCKIIRCEVQNSVNNGISVGRVVGGGGDGDARGNCDNTLVMSNSTHHNGGAGIYVYCSAALSVENNIIYRNTGNGGILIYARGTSIEPSYYKYNISYSNAHGMEISYKNERGDHRDNLVENCVFCHNVNDGIFNGCGYTRVKNSIIFRNGRYGLREDTYGWASWTSDLGTSYNCVLSNGSADYSSNGDGLIAGTGDIGYDPQFETLSTGAWATSYLLRNAYRKNRAPTGDTLISPCIDAGDPATAVAAPDLRIDMGALNTTNSIGYPDAPSGLGPASATGGEALSVTTVTLFFTLNDRVVPSSVETLRYNIQLAQDSSFSSLAADYSSSYAAGELRSYTASNLATGPYYWRVQAEDNRQTTTGNKSSWSIANSGDMAFYIGTPPGTDRLPARVRIIGNLIHLDRQEKCRVLFIPWDASEAVLSVYDIKGRPVWKKIFSGAVTGVEYEIDWDGKDQEGRPAGYGAYLIHFKAGALELKEKALVVK